MNNQYLRERSLCPKNEILPKFRGQKPKPHAAAEAFGRETRKESSRGERRNLTTPSLIRRTTHPSKPTKTTSQQRAVELIHTSVIS